MVVFGVGGGAGFRFQVSGFRFRHVCCRIAAHGVAGVDWVGRVRAESLCGAGAPCHDDDVCRHARGARAGVRD